MLVIPTLSAARGRNLALVSKQYKFPRFASDDKAFWWFQCAAGDMTNCHEVLSRAEDGLNRILEDVLRGELDLPLRSKPTARTIVRVSSPTSRLYVQ